MASSPFPYGIGGRLVSRYGVRPGRTSGVPTFHAGIDLWAPRGTPISPFEPGTVSLVGRDEERGRQLNGYGNAVVVRHDDGTELLYAHMATAPLVRVGDRVAPGRGIGLVGKTTNGTWPTMPSHLHAELRSAGGFPGPYGPRNSIDPVPWLAARGLTFGPRGVIQASGPPIAMLPPTSKTAIGMGYVFIGPEKTLKTGIPPGPYRYEPVWWERTGPLGLNRIEMMTTLGASAVVVAVAGVLTYRNIKRRRAA